jgi:hypothetical protein
MDPATFKTIIEESKRTKNNSLKSKPLEVVKHTSMDPASFKTIIEQSKHDMVEYRKKKPLDPMQKQNKQVWKDFLDRNAKKRKKGTNVQNLCGKGSYTMPIQPKKNTLNQLTI